MAYKRDNRANVFQERENEGKRKGDKIPKLHGKKIILITLHLK